MQTRCTSINCTSSPAYKSPCSALSKTPDLHSQQISFGSMKRVNWWTDALPLKMTGRSCLIWVSVECFWTLFLLYTQDAQTYFKNPSLDSIWPLITVFDWAIGVIARAMREAILVGASAEWQGSEDSLIIGEPKIPSSRHPPHSLTIYFNRHLFPTPPPPPPHPSITLPPHTLPAPSTRPFPVHP